MPKPEVVVIGIDGATFNLVRPWVEMGYLPALRDLLQTGVRGTLRSLVPPGACPGWKSLSTGKNPGQLGVFNWRNRVPGSYAARVVDPASMGAGSDLWTLISSAGRKVAVVGEPLVYPPRPVNGVLLTGMLTPPDSPFSYPEEFGDEVARHIGAYLLDPAVESLPGEDDLLQEQISITINRYQALRYILKSGDYDFAAIYFTAPDRLQHHFWPPINTKDHVVLKAYQQVDWAIAQIRGLIDADTTMVVASDHGFSDTERFIHLNQLFSNLGWLVARMTPGGIGPRLGFTRQNLGRVARRLGLDRVRARVPEAIKQIVPLGQFGLDMSRTRAWAWPGGEVFVNLRGREPEGIVEPGEYEPFRDRIIEGIKDLQDDGRHLDIRVYRREDVYSGPRVDEAPDLVVDVREPGYCLAGEDSGFDVAAILPGSIFTINPGRGGRHDTEGIFVAAGPEVRAGEDVEGARLLDVAPTILHLMGLPVPADVDGRVLPIFRAGSEPANRPVQFGPGVEEVAGEAAMAGEERERRP